MDEVSRLITRKLENMVDAADSNLIQSRRKAISVLFPHAVHLARRGQREMLDAFSHVARASDSEHFMWHHIKSFTMTLFDKPNPPPLNWVLGLIWPRVLFYDQSHNNGAVAWPAAALSYTEEVDWSAVDEVLRVAFITPGRPTRTEKPAVREVRALGDTMVLRSYLLLLWSQWDDIDYEHEDFIEMQIAIRESFSGIGMWRYREDLIQCLDEVLEGLERIDCPEELEYGELRRLLLEVDGRAEKILTGTPPWLIHFGLPI